MISIDLVCKKIANVIPAASVKQSAKVLGPLVKPLTQELNKRR